jgi:hypothetical protein
MSVYLPIFCLTLGFTFIADLLHSATGDTFTRQLSKKINVFQYSWLETIIFLFASAPLLIITCFRYGVGHDYFYTYVPDFNRMLAGLPVHSDPGFVALYSLIQMFSKNPQSLFVVTGALIVLAMIYSAYRINGTVTLSVALFFLSDHYFRSLQFVSQYTATALLFWALAIQIDGKKNKIFVLLLLFIAVSLHSSAILPAIIIALIPLFNFRKKIILTFSVALPAICLVLYRPINNLLLLVAASSRFDYYLQSSWDEVYTVDGRHSLSSILIEGAVLSFMVITLFFYRGEIQPVHYAGLILQSIAFSLALLQGEVPLLERIIFYFAVFQVLTLPMFIRLIRTKQLKVLIVFVVIATYSIWFFLYVVPSDLDEVIPYFSVFNPMHAFN